VLAVRGDTPAPEADDYSALWAADARRWNEGWGDLLNSHRASLGLAPVSDVRGHILTDRPWLAADPTLAPWPDPGDGAVFQTGAWILPDERPLAPELERFLDAGDPPVYFGFGSIRAPEGLGRAMIAAARALGRRRSSSPSTTTSTTGPGAEDWMALHCVHRTTPAFAGMNGYK
jgi:vancomycin aglycone glucosyltransferase